MSRFVLDCAVSRPVAAQTAQWASMAATRAWARPSGGYHEAKVSQALLQEAGRTVGQACGGHGDFATDPGTAVAQAVLESAMGQDVTAVLSGQADPIVVQEASAAAAAQLGLPHRILPVDARARLVDLPEGPAVLATAMANPEIGTMQADLGAWRAATGSRIVLEASCAIGWAELPPWWDHLVLDPRAWGAVPGAVAIVSRRARTAKAFENVPAAVVAGLTLTEWLSQAPSQREHTRAQVARIAEQVRREVPDVDVHGGASDDLPHILSLSVLYVDAEALQSRLDARGYAVGSGSACASRSGQPSHVLAAIGGLTSGNVRLGLPPGLADTAVDAFIDAFVEVVAGIRAEMGTASW